MLSSAAPTLQTHGTAPVSHYNRPTNPFCILDHQKCGQKTNGQAADRHRHPKSPSALVSAPHPPRSDAPATHSTRCVRRLPRGNKKRGTAAGKWGREVDNVLRGLLSPRGGTPVQGLRAATATPPFPRKRPVPHCPFGLTPNLRQVPQDNGGRGQQGPKNVDGSRAINQSLSHPAPQKYFWGHNAECSALLPSATRPPQSQSPAPSAHTHFLSQDRASVMMISSAMDWKPAMTSAAHLLPGPCSFLRHGSA